MAFCTALNCVANASKVGSEKRWLSLVCFAAIDLGGMTGRKKTIAGLPQATALTRSWLRILRSLLGMIRIEFGQSGALVP